MEKVELNKTIYGATKSHNSLDEEFVEFVPKKYTIDEKTKLKPVKINLTRHHISLPYIYKLFDIFAYS